MDEPHSVDLDEPVDIGIVTWNTADLSVQALRRVIDATRDVPIRLLVHDNASGDGTTERICAEVPEAEVERSETNLGFAAGMNRLLSRASSRWFLALNSDAWPAPGAVASLVRAGEARRNAAIVVPRLERPDGTLEASTFPFPSLRVAALMAFGGAYRVVPDLADRWCLPGGWHHDRPRSVPWAVGAAWLMRTRAVSEIGGFDQRFFMYAEDLEWCHRARQQGWEVWFEPRAVVTHVGNASGARRFGPRRTEAHVANSYRWAADHHSPVWIAAHRGLSAAGSLRLSVLAAARGDRRGRNSWRRMARTHLTAPAR